MTDSNGTTQIDIALAYAAHGWPVFPARDADDYDRETGEVLAIKTPLLTNGFRGATKNERILRELWKRHPTALIAGPTGEAMGAFVLDIDLKAGIGNGFEWLEMQEDLHGKLPDTAQVATVNGGRHYYFNFVAGIRNRGSLGSCVDIRGTGGYCVLPGSVLADGREYQWLDHEGITPPPIADAPQWLIDLLLPPVREQRQAGEYAYTPSDHAPYTNAAVEAEMRTLANTGPGNRGYQLNASAFSLGQLVGAGALSRSQAEDELYRAAQHNGVLATDGEPETLRKIRRGLDAGEKEPRVIPDRQEDNTRLIDVTRMIENGLRKAAEKKAAEKKAAEKKAAAQESSKTPERDHSASAKAESTETAPIGVAEPPATAEAAPASTPPAIYATPFNFLDATKLPRRSFVFGTHYIRKYVSVTVAPGGLGKTANSIVDILSMASGKRLAGTKPSQRFRCWAFNSEDPRDELERRIMGACIHYGLSAADIDGHLFLDTGREQELVVAREDKRTGIKINEPVVEAVVEQIQRLGIDVMIVDPFVSTHGVNENDNGAIDKVAKLWAQIADVTNCSIDIVHHLRKQQEGREATVEDARGAVSLIGAARSVRVLNRMSEEQATAGGLQPGDRFGYFSITYGKSNLTPLTHNQDWRKLVSVGLGNGGKGNLKSINQDLVPVVTEWTWPNKSETVDGITEEQRELIAVRVENSMCKFNPQAGDWIGHEIAFVMGWDSGDKAVKAKVRRMVDAWLEDGFLVKERKKDPVRREFKEFVTIGKRGAE